MGDEPAARLRAIAEEVLGDFEEVIEVTPLASLFHRVWSVVPQDQDIVDTSPDDTVGDALARMAEHDFTQLPFVLANRCSVSSHTAPSPGEPGAGRTHATNRLARHAGRGVR